MPGRGKIKEMKSQRGKPVSGRDGATAIRALSAPGAKPADAATKIAAPHATRSPSCTALKDRATKVRIEARRFLAAPKPPMSSEMTSTTRQGGDPAAEGT